MTQGQVKSCACLVQSDSLGDAASPGPLRLYTGLRGVVPESHDGIQSRMNSAIIAAGVKRD